MFFKAIFRKISFSFKTWFLHGLFLKEVILPSFENFFQLEKLFSAPVCIVPVFLFMQRKTLFVFSVHIKKKRFRSWLKK